MIFILQIDFIQKIFFSLVFKGCGDEKLVLCTENETYEVKEGEISNSLMVCPDLLYKDDLNKIRTDQREIKELQVRYVNYCFY